MGRKVTRNCRNWIPAMRRRTIILTILVLTNIVLLLWAVYSVLRGEISIFLGLLYIVGVIWLTRNYLMVYRKYSFIAPGFSLHLSISATTTQGMTPAFV